jgi:hypothetical protein
MGKWTRRPECVVRGADGDECGGREGVLADTAWSMWLLKVFLKSASWNM